MTLRPEVVLERLRKLRSVVRNLSAYRAIDPQTFSADFRSQWVVERGLQLAAEVVFDIGNHVLSGALNVTPQDYRDVIARLTEHGVITAELGDRLHGLGGFRNLLVHAYLDIDSRRVYEFVRTRLDDFTDFAEQIEGWLDKQG